jgi:hypothetical protein
MSSSMGRKDYQDITPAPDDFIFFLSDHFTKQEQQKFQATIADREDDTWTNTPYLGDTI